VCKYPIAVKFVGGERRRPKESPGMDAVSSLALPRLDRSRLMAAQVFELLRERIISLELSPGTVLSRAALAEEFRLSSSPIRDALIRLEDEQLVEVFPQHATVVSPIDLSLARQAQFLRRSVELEVVRTLAEAHDPRLVHQLEDIVARQETMLEANDLQEFTSGDQLFHRKMYEAARLPDLWVLVRRQSGHLDRLRRLHLPTPGKAVSILRDHRLILRAIADRKPEDAQRHLREHLSSTLSHVDEIRARFPTYLRDSP
jgi:GntR family transcriptional regulator, rspAB operon transcriptional repressor